MFVHLRLPSLGELIGLVVLGSGDGDAMVETDQKHACKHH
jgi:hypothetical protein